MQPSDWQRLPEHALMELSPARMGLSIADTALEPLIQKLYGELAAKSLVFQPPCFLADEWFCPVGIPAIGIPFYLAHPRLRQLEKKKILEVEGGTKTEFMKLIRHETGHAYSYAFGLQRRKAWRDLFGSAATEYPDTYQPKPYSKSYVTHLENWYAQSHPDEDFAETFAVWLTPGLNWRKRYRGWKALEKLEYVDRVMAGLAGKSAPVPTAKILAGWAGIGFKLKTYFQKKMKLYEDCYPDFYDRDLKTLFTDLPLESSDVSARDYLKKSYVPLVRAVAVWTREKQYTIDQLMQRLIRRVAELRLYVRQGSADMDLQLAAYISTLVNTHLFTGKFKRSK